MIREAFDVAKLEAFLKATATHLENTIVRQPTPSGGQVAGWHNHFPKDRIGNIGTALPLLFLHEYGRVQNRREILDYLVSAQKSGGWDLVSIPRTATTDATVWPLVALAAAGDQSTRKAISEAEQWLINQQKENGSWGATREEWNAPRVLTTARVIDALLTICAPCTEAVNKGVRWLVGIQRRNGAWGPTDGADGTVVHTAVALQALLRAGFPADDQAVRNGMDYILKEWEPGAASMIENVEVYTGRGEYHRQINQHDVDTEVLATLLCIRPTSAIPKVCAVVQRITAEFSEHGRLRPGNEQLTVWNTVPQARAVARFLRSLPISGQGHGHIVGKTLCLTPDAGAPPGLILRRVGHWSKRHILLLLSVLVILTVTALYAAGKIAGRDMLLSLFVPAALTVIERALVAKRKKRS